MTRKAKSLGVTSEMRRKWLQRHDEMGEPIQEIAMKDNYGQRTVRDQIDKARQEREMRESRIGVLKDATRDHYQDLCRFAQQLDSQIGSQKSTADLTRDPLYSALRQHLKSSHSLWRLLNSWDDMLRNLAEDSRALRETLIVELTQDPGLTAAFEGGKFNIGSLVDMLMSLAAQQTEHGLYLDVNEWFRTGSGEAVFSNPMLGAYHLGTVPAKQEPQLKQALADFLSRANQIDQYQKQQDRFRQVHRLTAAIHDEMTTIILRRVVSGRCKYCPTAA